MSSGIERAIHEEVTLSAYDPKWPSLFESERSRLVELFPRHFMAIEHFGSTAVPGMPAKPIIDLLGGVESMAVAGELCEALLDQGYTTSREFNAMLPDRKWLMRVANGRRTHHLHLVVSGSEQWAQRLRFRDLLIADAELARQYAELKYRLAVQHRTDREAYTQAKTEFIAAALAQ